MNWNQLHHWFWHFPYQFCIITIFTGMPLLPHFTNQSCSRSKTFVNTRFFLCNSCNRKVKLWPGSSFAIPWFSRVRSRTGKRSFIGGWAKVVIPNKESFFSIWPTHVTPLLQTVSSDHFLSCDLQVRPIYIVWRVFLILNHVYIIIGA